MAMIDPVPDLLEANGFVTNPQKLATLGRPVSGIAADGVTIVLLRFRANFPGEKLQIAILDRDGGISRSAARFGALSPIQATTTGETLPFHSLNFDAGPIGITAAGTDKGPIGFALYRVPAEFSEEWHIAFQVQSADVSCFAFNWPSR